MLDSLEATDFNGFITELHSRLRGPKEAQLFPSEVPVTVKAAEYSTYDVRSDSGPYSQSPSRIDLSTVKKVKAGASPARPDFRRDHTQISNIQEVSRMQKGNLKHASSTKAFESQQRNNETSVPKTLKSFTKREARGKPEKSGALGRLLPELIHTVKKVSKQDLNGLLLDSIKKTRVLRVCEVII